MVMAKGRCNVKLIIATTVATTLAFTPLLAADNEPAELALRVNALVDFDLGDVPGHRECEAIVVDGPFDALAHPGYAATNLQFHSGRRVFDLLGSVGNRLIALLVGKSYTDFTNGFKGFRRHVVEEMMQPLVCGEFNLTIEMSLKAVLGGATFAVVPNSWVQRAAGESKFRLFSLGWLYLITIVYCLIDARLKRSGSVR
jgi:hypothetical protein